MGLNRLRKNAPPRITTPAQAPPLLNQEGSFFKELPSSDEEGWRAERRGGADTGIKGWC